MLCTPHRLHAEQIVAAAAAGRHVFCEKPLTTSGQEARAAIAAVREAGVQLGIGHERRFEPAVQRLREMCRERRARYTAGAGGQLQPGQVPRPPGRQLAALRRSRAGRSAVRDRHPSGRPGHRRLRPSDRGVGAARHPRDDLRERRHPHCHDGLREGPDRADHGDPHHALRRPGDRARLEGVGGDPGPQPPRGPAGLGRHDRAPRRRSGDGVLPPAPERARQPGGLRARRTGAGALPGVAGGDAVERGGVRGDHALGAFGPASNRWDDAGDVHPGPDRRTVDEGERCSDRRPAMVRQLAAARRRSRRTWTPAPSRT